MRDGLIFEPADALAREVHQRADLLKRDAATGGDVQRAELGHLPHLAVGEVELDRARSVVHVEVEVMLA